MIKATMASSYIGPHDSQYGNRDHYYEGPRKKRRKRARPEYGRITKRDSYT